MIVDNVIGVRGVDLWELILQDTEEQEAPGGMNQPKEEGKLLVSVGRTIKYQSFRKRGMMSQEISLQ